MKKIFTHLLLIAVMLVAGMSTSYAQAKIEFDKLTNNFGTFSESNPVQKCTFTFTNKGDKPLIINQAVASCGCTVPTYTKTPIMPGGKGVVSVTYNGKGKFPGHFKKTITIRTNGVPEMTRLYVEGVMQEEQKQ
jgi:endonuclease YncB( thermonuclease family)